MSRGPFALLWSYSSHAATAQYEHLILIVRIAIYSLLICVLADDSDMAVMEQSSMKLPVNTSDGGNFTVALALHAPRSSESNLGWVCSWNSTCETLFKRSKLMLVSLQSPLSHSGCPTSQKWCLYTPAIRAQQLIFGFMFIAIGYAFTGDLPFQMPFSPKLNSNFVF